MIRNFVCTFIKHDLTDGSDTYSSIGIRESSFSCAYDHFMSVFSKYYSEYDISICSIVSDPIDETCELVLRDDFWEV